MFIQKEEIKKLPKNPGVYIFRNNQGEIIYIGKALVLKNRVSSYFKGNLKDQKTKILVSQIANIEYIVVNSEFEALLLEAKLIKEHLPKYNIQLRDNKSYLYIAISKDEFPRVYTLRRPDLEKNITNWYGPFASSTATKQVLRHLRRLFPFRSCQNIPKEVCLYYHISLCPGVCVKPSEDYKNNINNIKQFLSGKIGNLIKDFKKEMNRAAKSLDYETANSYKQKIEYFQKITQGWRNIPVEKRKDSNAINNLKKIIIKYSGIDPVTINRIEGYDISNLGKDIIVGSMVVFLNGESDSSQYRQFKINFQSLTINKKLDIEDQNDPAAISQIIKRRFNHPEWVLPQLIIVDGGKTQIGAAYSAIKEKLVFSKIAIIGITKKEEKIIIPKIINNEIKEWKTLSLGASSPTLQLIQRIRDESHRFAQKYYKKLHLKRSLETVNI